MWSQDMQPIKVILRMYVLLVHSNVWRQQCLIKAVVWFKYDSEKFQQGEDESRKQFVSCAFLFVLKHVLPGL